MNTPISARLPLLIVLYAAVFNLGAEPIQSSEYFPLDDGNYWTFSVNGPYNNTYVTTNTILPGTTWVNGVPTKALQYSNDGYWNFGYTEYYTSDGNGVRLHQVFDPEPPQSTFVFEPPIALAGPAPSIPSTLTGSGTARTFIPDASPNPYLLNYTSTSRIEAMETISVPAGTYNTVRHVLTLRIFGYIQTPEGTVYLDEESTQTLWAAQFIGPVRQRVVDSLGTSLAVLTDTNVGPPEPQQPAPTFMPWLPLLLE